MNTGVRMIDKTPIPPFLLFFILYRYFRSLAVTFQAGLWTIRSKPRTSNKII